MYTHLTTARAAHTQAHSQRTLLNAFFPSLIALLAAGLVGAGAVKVAAEEPELLRANEAFTYSTEAGSPGKNC